MAFDMRDKDDARKFLVFIVIFLIQMSLSMLLQHLHGNKNVWLFSNAAAKTSSEVITVTGFAECMHWNILVNIDSAAVTVTLV